MAPASKCREYYVSQAVSDGAKAMVFYNLANETGTSLSGAAVGPASAIPVYLLQFATAAPILQAMQGYSVGLRDVPFGQNLSRMYDAKDWVRLTLSIDRSRAILNAKWRLICRFWIKAVISWIVGLLINRSRYSLHPCSGDFRYYAHTPVHGPKRPAASDNRW